MESPEVLEESDSGDISVESGNGATTSTSTLGSVLSVSVTSKKQKNVAKKQSLLAKRKEKKRQKKVEKNKISKEDFYSKHTEFRTWLWEEKNIKFEELNAGKSKDYFKKFVKKWNNKKLPKHYYRGIVSCWCDGSPATQTLWAIPKDVEMTPSSLREEALDLKYSRVTTDIKSLGTFGKRQGQQALRQLQTMFINNLNDQSPETNNSDTCDDLAWKSQKGTATQSTSSLPEVSTTCLIRPRPPRRTCSLSNMQSRSQGTTVEDCTSSNLQEKRKDIEKENFASTSKKRSSPSGILDSIRNFTPRKLQKKDSYVSKIESTSQSFFANLNLRSGKKVQPSLTKKTRPVSMDSSAMWRQSPDGTALQGKKKQFTETPRCATLRHSTHLSVLASANKSSFDTYL